MANWNKFSLNLWHSESVVVRYFNLDPCNSYSKKTRAIGSCSSAKHLSVCWVIVPIGFVPAMSLLFLRWLLGAVQSHVKGKLGRPAICNDSSLYELASNWEKTFLRLPQLLDNTCTVAEYEEDSQQSLQAVVEAEAFDAQVV